MSKLKFPHSAGWFVAGVAVAVLVIPTAVAGATAALTFTGIEGATGGTLANVTKAGQLEVTSAGASQMYVHTIDVNSALPSKIGPPAGDGLIITSIHIWENVTGCRYGMDIILHGIKTSIGSSSCTPGVTVLPFEPGLPIPTGQSLYVTGDGVGFSVVGYTVPASAVPAGSG
jgi:hypothetical protein